VPLICL